MPLNNVAYTEFFYCDCKRRSFYTGSHFTAEQSGHALFTRSWNCAQNNEPFFLGPVRSIEGNILVQMPAVSFCRCVF